MKYYKSGMPEDTQREGMAKYAEETESPMVVKAPEAPKTHAMDRLYGQGKVAMPAKRAGWKPKGRK